MAQEGIPNECSNVSKERTCPSEEVLGSQGGRGKRKREDALAKDSVIPAVGLACPDTVKPWNPITNPILFSFCAH